LVQEKCTFKNNPVLSKFTHLKTLNLGPNEYTDLSFINKLPHLQTLALYVTSKIAFTNSLEVIEKCISISSFVFTASNNSFQFPDNFRLPSQLNEVMLGNFNLKTNIIGTSSKIENIHIRCVTFIDPTFFKDLSNLKIVIIEPEPELKSFNLTNIKVNHLRICSAKLKELAVENLVCEHISYRCPKLDDITYIHPRIEKF